MPSSAVHYTSHYGLAYSCRSNLSQQIRAIDIPSYVRTNNKLIGLVFVLALSSVNIFKSLSLSFGQSQNHDLSTNIASVPSTSAKDQAREVEDKESSANPEQLNQDTSAKQPIAWLMTFPNSGTSYTSRLVATVTCYRGKGNSKRRERKVPISQVVYRY